MRRQAENLIVAAGLACLTAVAIPHPALAAGAIRGHVVVVSHTAQSVRLAFTAPELPAGVALSPAAVQVTLDGQPARVTAAVPAAQSHRVARRAVLVVDTSGSMAGAGIAGARRSADAFLAAVPADVQVGLVAFSDRPHVLVAPTTSRATVRAAVGRLQAAGETSLYDAVALGLQLLGKSGERSLVVLSDGADTRSHMSPVAVTAALKASGARMDAVGFNTGVAVRRALTSMAAATGGRVTSAADAGQLAAAFATAAHAFATELTLDVAVPAALQGHEVRVDVTAATSAGLVAALTTLSVGSAPSAPGDPAFLPVRPTAVHHFPLFPIATLFLGLAGVLFLAVAAFDERRSPRTRVRRLLGDYSFAKKDAQSAEADASRVGSGAIARRAVAVATRITAKPERRAKLIVRLARADVSFSPAEWLVIQITLTLGGGAFATILFRTILGGLVVGLLGFVGSNLWLSFKGRQRVRAFNDQLPNSLQMVAGSLRAGFSFPQALDAVVQDGQEPIAGEMHRALAESRLGVPLEDALEGISERMGSTDFRWVVMAIRIQREVGGNLAEVLLNTSGMMRERARLHRQVRALSAEGRLSAYILLALPVFLGLYMFMLRRTYIRPLYTQPLGIAMLVLALILVTGGAAIMRKIVTVEV